MKYFRMSYEEILFKRSYLNILLLNRSIPSTKFDKDGDNDRGHPRPRPAKPKVSKQHYRHESELFAGLM